VFNIDGQDVELTGTVDAVLNIAGDNVLVDFKTTSFGYTQMHTTISPQLKIYALLLSDDMDIHSVGFIELNKRNGGVSSPIRERFNKAIYQEQIESLVKNALYLKNNIAKNPYACINGYMKCPYIEKCWA
jgi:hypothetical protein